MKNPSLKTILLDHLQETQGWTTKGQLGLITEQAGYLPESCGRILRSAEEEGKILVSYYQGKRRQKLARYAKLNTEKPLPPKAQVEIVKLPSGEYVAVV